MRNLGKVIKGRAGIVIALATVVILTSGATYAATILFDADQVGFDKTGTSLTSTDVQGALTELYERSISGSKIEPMQNYDKTKLSSVGDSTIVYDTRDNNTYRIRKLADGNVWMTENLRIVDKTITSDDSNLPEGTTYTIPASNLSSFTTAYNTNAAYLANNNYGVYYNFYTATAGWGTNSVNSGNSPKDICPKGWRLPTGGSTGEFRTLYNNYNSSALLQGDPGLILSGYAYYGSLGNQGTYGYFWSSAVYGANFAYSLGLDSSGVTPADVSNKYYGLSIRCIAQ